MTDRNDGIPVVAALIRKNGKLLISRRPQGKARAGLWEFIGGKAEAGESDEEALVRECREELGVEIRVSSLYMELTHRYPDLAIRLRLYNAEIIAGTPVCIEHQMLRWILPAEITQYEFCPADAAILKRLMLEEQGRMA